MYLYFLNVFITEHDSGMVQLQVACHKKKQNNGKSTANRENSQKHEECDIISELLFHNDGATDTVNNILPRITPPSPQPQEDIDENVKIMTSLSSSVSSIKNSNIEQNIHEKICCDEEEEVIKSNIVMFEYREQMSNLVGEEVEPFASFFDNDCDLFEKVKPGYSNISYIIKVRTRLIFKLLVLNMTHTKMLIPRIFRRKNMKNKMRETV